MNEKRQILAIEAEGLKKSYLLGKNKVEVLKNVHLGVEVGEWVALLGASGSGKTTLLNVLGSLEKPDSGSVWIFGSELRRASNSLRNELRRKQIGFVFQSYYLIPELSTIENVMFPALIDGKEKNAAKAIAGELLDAVGLSHRLEHKPMELSGGEQQRAAIARALVNSPPIILADEPTGNLDSKTGEEILKTLFKLKDRNPDKTFLMVTHDYEVAGMADRIIHLKDGVITDRGE